MGLWFSIWFFRQHRLRRMHSHCIGIVQFLVWALSDRPGKAIRDCAEIVWKPCDAGGIAMQSRLIPNGNHTALVRAQYRGPTVMVQWLCKGGMITVQFFPPKDHLKSEDFCKIRVQPLHDACMMPAWCSYNMSMGSWFFQFVISSH